eukprot:scaffold22152_cov51-Isochrysis_galbana.AAC.1
MKPKAARIHICGDEAQNSSRGSEPSGGAPALRRDSGSEHISGVSPGKAVCPCGDMHHAGHDCSNHRHRLAGPVGSIEEEDSWFQMREA